MANTKFKSNIHMASLTEVRLAADLNAYFDRKVLKGQNKMSVLNAIKSKLLAGVLAFARNGYV